MMLRIKAFILGMWECQEDLTFAFPLYAQQQAYDAGREFGRRLLGVDE